MRLRPRCAPLSAGQGGGRADNGNKRARRRADPLNVCRLQRVGDPASKQAIERKPDTSAAAATAAAAALCTAPRSPPAAALLAQHFMRRRNQAVRTLMAMAQAAGIGWCQCGPAMTARLTEAPLA